MSGTNEMITNAYTWVLFALQSVSAYYFAMSDQKPRIHNFYLGASITTAYLLFNRVISNVLNAHTNHVVYFVTTLLVDIIVFSLLGEWESFRKNVGYATITWVIFYASTVAASFLVEAVSGVNLIASNNRSEFNALYVLATPLVTLLAMIMFEIVICIMRIRNGKSQRFTSMVMLGITGYQILLVFILYYNASAYSMTSITFAMVVVIFTILMDIILLALMNDIDRRHEKEEQYRILEGLSQEEYDYYQKKQKDLEALRTKRHEYVNRLTLLSVQLEEQQRVAEEEGKEI